MALGILLLHTYLGTYLVPRYLFYFERTDAAGRRYHTYCFMPNFTLENSPMVKYHEATIGILLLEWSSSPNHECSYGVDLALNGPRTGCSIHHFCTSIEEIYCRLDEYKVLHKYSDWISPKHLQASALRTLPTLVWREYNPEHTHHPAFSAGSGSSPVEGLG
jgi:hypothetical protein